MELPGLNSCMLWLVLFLQIHQLFSLTLLEGKDADKLSLLAFKSQIVDPFGALSSWNESLHFCEWSGVVCGRQHQRVVELDLNSRQLKGSLSPHIGNLSFLRMLNLENNSLSHNIPEELGRLFRLEVLRLGNNTFYGEIPVNISLCSNLQFLDLERNNLSGKIPSSIGSLTKLQLLVFDSNNLAGEIPASFGNLSSLEQLFVVVNNLQGSIPDTIGKLQKLQYLSFGLNNLSGTIPSSIYNISSLTFFSVPVNQLHGSLPPDLGLTLPNLEVLYLHSNQFSGPIPSTVSNATNLTSLQLFNNSFTGKVPNLASLPNLQQLYIYYNNLGNGEDDDLSFLSSLANNTNFVLLDASVNNIGGVLPEIISNFSTKCGGIGLGGNQIRGSIPTEIGNLINLHALVLESNRLDGIIPSSMGWLQNLAILHLNGNKISGTIPSSLGNATSLLDVDLRQNDLQGAIPKSLGNWQNLLSLSLSQNNLSGPIPNELVGLASLSLYLDLSENQLTGSIPFEVGKLVNLGHLSISRNMLSGEIPESLGSCTNLEKLLLEGNFLQGPIPESLSSLRGLRDLNLSYNNLTGQIPLFLAEFKLESLDLSFNDLQGEVPLHGVFENASAVSVLGNKNLCGGIPQFNLSQCAIDKSTKSRSSTQLVLKITIPCGFLAVVFVIFSLLFYCLRKSKSKHASGSTWEVPFQRVAYQDLLQATNCFSSANLIGVGSFGSVYKGTLSSNGWIVAVKVLNLLCKGASKSFMAECAALANIRHRNLVKLLTACSSIDFQGNEFKALVYEFMVNGSVEEWLHPISVSDEEHMPRSLNLIQRLNIAIDVASALDYLHNHCQVPIVHCDLKPSNVLLDADMTAHVGDFGLARFLRPDFHQLSSDQTSSVGLKGTIGYAAPEYAFGSEVSTYGDVYSYGILLLEMFTGKSPIDGMFKDGLNLHNYAKMSLPDRGMKVMDPVLLEEIGERSAECSFNIKSVGSHRILERLVSVIRIGVNCSVELPRERMDISRTVVELCQIRDLLLGTRTHGQHEINVIPEAASPSWTKDH